MNMTMIFVPAFWLVLSVIVGVAADTRGRSFVGWFFGALVFSPLLAVLLLLAVPARPKSEKKAAVEPDVPYKRQRQVPIDFKGSWQRTDGGTPY